MRLGRKRYWLIWVCACLFISGILAVAFVTIVEYILTPGQISERDNPRLVTDVPQLIPSHTRGYVDTAIAAADSRITERQTLLKRKCIIYRDDISTKTDTRTRMLYSNKLNATMCYVPKAGCTFWKRVFLLAENVKAGKSFDISHLEVHFVAIKSMLDSQGFDDSYSILRKSKRLLFTREPFSRLFSVYIDKFYLSNFWSYGGTIISFHRPYPTKTDIKCGSSVTFQEFLNYVANSNHNPPYEGPQEHWISVSRLCRPCTFEYDIIGHQETFDEDRDYIIKLLGIEKFLGVPIKLSVTFYDAIYQLVRQHWTVIQFGKLPCITSENYLRRIWKALQFQGYLPYEAPFPARFIGGGLLANLDINTTTSVIYKATNVENLTSDSWKARKVRFLSIVYRDIDMKLKEKIRELFHHDQMLFGYDTRPEYVYGTPYAGF